VNWSSASLQQELDIIHAHTDRDRRLVAAG
jgi:hypothetical protein